MLAHFCLNHVTQGAGNGGWVITSTITETASEPHNEEEEEGSVGERESEGNCAQHNDVPIERVCRQIPLYY